MKRLLPLLCILCLALSGCASYYVIVLSNGTRITTKGKPKLDHGRYYYTDIGGKSGVLPEGRVREIGPASMEKENRFQTGPGGVNAQ